jgi:hypothetical protein
MSGYTKEFDEVFHSEIKAINCRRSRLNRDKITLTGQHDSREVIDAAGLALSGGGIRSAAFCLGALQGLDRAQLINKIDYLSTVSGGGYIGSSLVAAMSSQKEEETDTTGRLGNFPFESRLDLSETPSVQHIRDYSNYLFPHFAKDLFKGIAIYLRGLAANVVLIAPWMLLLAAASAILNQDLATWDYSEYKKLWYNWFGVQHFIITSLLAAFFFLCLLVWSLVRSVKPAGEFSSTRRSAPSLFALGIVALLVVALLEFQPIVLKWLILAKITPHTAIAADATRFDRFVKLLALFSTVVGIFSRFLSSVIGSATERSGMWQKMAGGVSIATIWLAAAAIPFLLWVGYIYLTFWAVPIVPHPGVTMLFAPEWLQNCAFVFKSDPLRVVYLYISASLILIALSVFLNPNANSLHRLYRDRLSKAFLFKPNEIDSKTKELVPQDDLRLSKIKTAFTPYPLINTAINLQGSKIANRRGRNADFFVLSPECVGSEATGYCSAATMEKVTKDLNLGTALAISGAAASSNMGAKSIKVLAPTLAILNIRLGYWLRNPMYVSPSPGSWLLDRADLYFLFEMFGLLGETRQLVYLTDGGHIENLAIYELLKRKCRIIIAIDAEADPAMTFGSFCSLQRFARIDLGVRIDLPWQDVSQITNDTSKAIAAGESPKRNSGPHCAVGTIYYPKGDRGYLIYIKSSMSGDENDYILNYKRRYPSFPHETTLDQLFSEEQFECYRSLGFHATLGVFGDRKKDPASDKRQDQTVKPSIGPDSDMTEAIERVLGVSLQVVESKVVKVDR